MWFNNRRNHIDRRSKLEQYTSCLYTFHIPPHALSGFNGFEGPLLLNEDYWTWGQFFFDRVSMPAAESELPSLRQ